MNTEHKSRTGGQILVDALRIHGVTRVFCIPGESYLAVLDALHDAKDSISVTVCRQEGGAAYMAEAYGKLTGEPGVCFVTRGPGATNASIGVHTALQDSTPMVLFVGQVAREQTDREAFQEIDYRQMFGGVAKWVVQIDDAGRIPELVSQAFHRAANGRPGPVVVALPEDMLTDVRSVTDAGSYQRCSASPDSADLIQLNSLLSAARSPLLVVGGGGWTAEAVANMQAFATRFDMPVAASFRCQDLFDNTHPNYVGDLGMAAGPELLGAVREADLLLVVGARLGELTTAGYTLVKIPVPAQKLVHVHLDVGELGRVYQPTLGIASSMLKFARALQGLEPPQNPRWRPHAATLRAAYSRALEPLTSPGPVQMSKIVRWLSERAPADAIITNGAGNYSAWLQRYFQYKRFRTQLAPTNGSMGYGVPAAVAAKLSEPERMVIAFAGDGCFLMNGQELATAVKYRANVIFIVVNNGMYGTIRMHQEREYPNRVSATDLVNPDFVMFARAFGCQGELVQSTDEFAPAFERAVESGKPALIEVRVDPEALTPRLSLTEIRAAALQRQKA
ncbi:thiamine pyrophosphate-binding protein [Paraburkholderia phenoliruptrix]|uniref:thiamine pyrophosphate-binding protein n=1 Tax=Paraburkholderia phenoliruptrix TaxID=252970 RepID=UPI002869A453|nr:thiamine pyrophosphate-binding protein [Paraburkholderia phenoliruptrix]WMY11023.1 thiamine pyrophosphate-binding protein [Paraburkholderia phenoliruptrix]